jgi:hypothetical protein
MVLPQISNAAALHESFHLRVIQFVRDCFTMGKNKTERQELGEEKKEVFALDLIAVDAHYIREELHCFCEQLKRLNDFLRAAQNLDLTQQGETMGVIKGILPGATGIFDLSTLPVGSSLQKGSIPTYASDNTTDVSALVPAADGMSFSVTAGAAPVATSFNVTATAISSSGATLTHVFNIPLLPAAVVPATDLDLNQRS